MQFLQNDRRQNLGTGGNREPFMKHSLRTGFSFGLTSGIITTLGLMIGLHSGTHSKIVIIGGILTIAIADAFSDALGIHISEESENRHTAKEIWESTTATFLSKFVVAITFVIPVLLFPLTIAVFVSIVWGLSLLGVFSFYIARQQRISPWKVITEHLLIAIIVIIITHYVGIRIGEIFHQ
jgi:VIT family.